MTTIDRSNWSGEGTFTQELIDWFVSRDTVAFVKVEDASSSRSEVEFNFISNELFVQFPTAERVEHGRWWGIVPRRRTIVEKTMTLAGLESALTEDETIASPDYADDGMIQFLRTERVIPPYQTKGYKLIELVRLYEVGAGR